MCLVKDSQQRPLGVVLPLGEGQGFLALRLSSQEWSHHGKVLEANRWVEVHEYSVALEARRERRRNRRFLR